jgi:hypothetical protein
MVRDPLSRKVWKPHPAGVRLCEGGMPTGRLMPDPRDRVGIRHDPGEVLAAPRAVVSNLHRATGRVVLLAQLCGEWLPNTGCQVRAGASDF